MDTGTSFLNLIRGDRDPLNVNSPSAQSKISNGFEPQLAIVNGNWVVVLANLEPPPDKGLDKELYDPLVYIALANFYYETPFSWIFDYSSLGCIFPMRVLTEQAQRLNGFIVADEYIEVVPPQTREQQY